MTDWLITNALVVNNGRSQYCDVRLADGRISRIAPKIAAEDWETVYDAKGRALLPGLIDDQVHFREPGLEHKATIATESRAAVAGGITSFMEMPNTKPPATTLEVLQDKYARAAKSSLANYAFYLGASNDNLEDIKRIKPSQTCGLKIFMGASTGNMLVSNPELLEKIFAAVPVLVVTHCEDTPTIDANMAAEKARLGDALDATRHPYIRSAEACLKSSTLAVKIAKRQNARLHVLHISTAEELALFSTGTLRSKRITAETCVHYTHFDARDYPRLGNFIKCNPSIKFEKDRDAIIAAIAEGRIDVLATDHAPHTLAEKQEPYATAPSGLPLVQHALQVALQRVREGKLTIETVVERFCHAPATLFGVRDRGFIREDYWADLVLVDLEKPQTVKREDVLSKCGWSPFEGETFGSSVVATWVNGHLAYNEGKFDDSQLGQALDCARGRD